MKELNLDIASGNMTKDDIKNWIINHTVNV